MAEQVPILEDRTSLKAEMMYDYDLAVIGSGPGGQRAAIQAGKLGKKVVLIEANSRIGGICLHDGTIPSKSFREAILALSGFRLRSHFGESFRVKQNVEMRDLTEWSGGIIQNIEQTQRAQLLRNKVELLTGTAAFIDPHQLRVTEANSQRIISAEYIVIATGTRPRRPEGFEFDDEVILDSSGILHLRQLPRSLLVVGGGVIGCEYASMLATIGVEVTLVEARPYILSGIDHEIREALSHYLRQQRATILVNEKVIRCKKTSDNRAVTYLDSGKKIVADVLLVSAGRVGCVEELNLAAVGIETKEAGRIPVDANLMTSVPHIYAVGDVSTVLGLASTAVEQGRLAACHAFKLRDPFEDEPHKLAFPYGIYSIPEIAMVGQTEAELTAAKIPYETGVARFGEMEKGKISGETSGMLKLLFNSENFQLLGVHAIGEGATELVHIGQAVMAQKNGLGLLIHMVFNYPSISQAYKVAALNAYNKIINAREAVAGER